jgi:hypothetical protein
MVLLGLHSVLRASSADEHSGAADLKLYFAFVCVQGGGGLSLTDKATLLAIDSSFIKNSGGGAGPASQDSKGRGGAAMLEVEASLTAINCRWEANQAGRDGGTLFAETQNTLVRLTNCTVSNNKAGAREVGGAVRVTKTTRLEVKGGGIFSNHAPEIGGAIAATGTTTVTLVDVDIYNNTVGNWGGGLGVWDSAHMLVDRSRVWGNTGRCWGGGAAAVFNTGVLTISRSHVWDNTDRNMAGAVSAWEKGQVHIIACNLSYNAASSHGGAVRVGDSATAVLRDSILAGNHVGRLDPCPGQPGETHHPRGGATSCGGAIFVGGNFSGRPDFASTVELINTTLTGNTAARGGGVCALPPAVTTRAQPDQVKVKIRSNSKFTGNLGTPGADVYALAATALSMPKGGGNINSSSDSVQWAIECGLGSVLDRTQGICIKCAAPTYMLEGGMTGHTANCSRCPEAAECYGGAVLVAKPKFYHTHGVGAAGGTVPTCGLDMLIR